MRTWPCGCTEETQCSRCIDEADLAAEEETERERLGEREPDPSDVYKAWRDQ